MGNLMEADAWMHMVLSSRTPLVVCEKKFREFSLMQDTFIRDEIKNNIIPDLEKRGVRDSAEAYKKILALLENIIAEKSMRTDITIRPETPRDYKNIVSLVLRSFKEGTDYSDGTDIIALIEEIRVSKYYIPELSFVAEKDGKIVGHFLFSHFPLSKTAKGGHIDSKEIVMLAPVSVHADYLHQHVGITMLSLGLRKVREAGFKGITVEGDYHFYNRVGFQTSSDYNIYPTSGYPLQEPRCMMCQETYEGSLKEIEGYIVYDMYYNA